MTPARSFAQCAARVAGLALLASCSSTAPPIEPAPAPPRPTASAPVATAPAPPSPAKATIDRAHARWVAVDWSDLPDWQHDRSADAWTAFLRGCERPPASWATLCAAAKKDLPGPLVDDAVARRWIEAHLRPWRIEALDGSGVGLATGYFEPLVEASRWARPGFRIALYAPPPDLATRKPYWTRREADTSPAARKSLRGSEIAWLRNPLDALLLQVQGSGRIQFVDERGRPQALVRLAFAAHNDQPYKSVGRWLVEQGELTLEQASWPAIRAWARAHPRRLDELLWSNPRLVFFREEPLPDPSVGPKGAQGVPLTPGRSVAVDPQSVPYGTPLWLDTTEPLSTTPLRRLVIAQDTGTAITGAVRVDYFWGWGDAAEAQAGRMKQPLRAWALWPR